MGANVILMRTGDGYVNLAAAAAFEVSPGWAPKTAPTPKEGAAVEDFLTYCESIESEPPDHWTVLAVFAGPERNEYVEILGLRAADRAGARAKLDEFVSTVLHACIYGTGE